MQIEKMGLFATPKSVDEIMEFIEALPKEQRSAAVTVLGLTWNFIAEQIEQFEIYGGDSV